MRRILTGVAGGSTVGLSSSLTSEGLHPFLAALTLVIGVALVVATFHGEEP